MYLQQLCVNALLVGAWIPDVPGSGSPSVSGGASETDVASLSSGASDWTPPQFFLESLGLLVRPPPPPTPPTFCSCHHQSEVGREEHWDTLDSVFKILASCLYLFFTCYQRGRYFLTQLIILGTDDSISGATCPSNMALVLPDFKSNSFPEGADVNYLQCQGVVVV